MRLLWGDLCKLDVKIQIEEFTLGMSFEQFRDDPKTIAAVERSFW